MGLEQRTADATNTCGECIRSLKRDNCNHLLIINLTITNVWIIIYLSRNPGVIIA